MAKPRKTSSSRRAATPQPPVPLDISQQIAGRIELTGKPPVLPPLNQAAGPRRVYVVGDIDGSGDLPERLVDCCFWTDMRGAAAEDLPAAAGPGYGLWAIEAAPDGPGLGDPHGAGENAFMGMLYRAADGRTILAPPRTPGDRALDDFAAGAGDCGCADCASDALADAVGGRGGEDGAVLISTTNCARSTLVQLSGFAYSGYRTTRAAAIAAAATNAQSYANGVALARGRRQSCGAGCRSCSSGSANVQITKRDSSVSLIASLFYFQWRYVGYVEFKYSFRVGCCRVGAQVVAA